MILTKTVDLGQLKTELAAAGITTNALSTTSVTKPPARTLGIPGDTLYTYDAAGAPCELPKGALVVLAAHVPIMLTTPDNELDTAIKASSTLTELKDALLGSGGGRVKARTKV